MSFTSILGFRASILALENEKINYLRMCFQRKITSPLKNETILHCKTVVFFADASDAVNVRTKGLKRV